MALCSAFFLEGWKRYSAGIRYKWGDVDQITPEAEHPRPEYFRRLQNVAAEYLREHLLENEVAHQHCLLDQRSISDHPSLH